MFQPLVHTIPFKSKADYTDGNHFKKFSDQIASRIEYCLPNYEKEETGECDKPSIGERLYHHLKVEKEMAKALEWKPNLPEITDESLDRLSKSCAVVYFILKDGSIRMWNGFFIYYHILITPNLNFQQDFTFDDVEIILVNTRTHISHLNTKELIADEETFQSVATEVSGNFLIISTEIRYPLSGFELFKKTLTLESPKWCVCMGHRHAPKRFCSLSIKKSMGCIYRDEKLSNNPNHYFGTYSVGSYHYYGTFGLPGSMVLIFDKHCEILGVGMHIKPLKEENVSVCLMLDENVQTIIKQLEEKLNISQRYKKIYYSNL